MPLAPEYAAMFAAMAEQPGPSISEMSPAQARELYRMMRPVNPDLSVANVEDATCPGPDGNAIGLRIYTPEGSGPFGTLVYYHGGGWVIGDLDCSDAVCRDLCRTAGINVVSVDYRLAPEHRYPAAAEDCIAATAWCAANASKLNSNGKLAVGGESAGGNLAAVVAQHARDNGGPAIALQLLLYPVVDCDMTQGSYIENAEGPLLETSTMHWFWDHYCPDTEQRQQPLAAPLRASSLAGLPPALVLTAEFDPLRDEGKAYADALSAAGSAAEYHCYDGLVHDFFATAQMFKASRPGLELACERLQQHLAS
ncbi:MAG: alpha/beta hydrolase [Pseudomonadales bacterium]